MMQHGVFDSFGRRMMVLLGLAVTLVLHTAWATPVHARARAWLGVTMESGPNGGVVVRGVVPQSPAAKGALKPGDMLLQADGVVLHTPRELGRLVAAKAPGDKLRLQLRRGGKDRTVTVVLAVFPGMETITKRMWIGKKAPDPTKLAAVTGKMPKRMHDLKGKVVLLDFFASWCGSCRAFAPQLAAWHAKYKAQGLTVLGVTSDETQRAHAVVRAWSIPYPVASDIGHTTASSYRVTALPAAFLIDKKGVIRDVLIGYNPQRSARTTKLIETLLKEK